LCASFSRNPFPRLAWARAVVPFLVPLKAFPRWLRAPLMWGSFSPSRAPAGLERAVAGVSAAGLRRRLAELLAVDGQASLGGITVPSLVLRAMRDRVISERATDLMTRELPDAQRVEIDGPHLLLQTRPTECAAAIGRFIQSLAARQGEDAIA